jgi:hypothetical protein
MEQKEKKTKSGHALSASHPCVYHKVILLDSCSLFVGKHHMRIGFKFVFFRGGF